MCMALIDDEKDKKAFEKLYNKYKNKVHAISLNILKSQYPAVVQLAARDYEPSFINRYLVELAAAFHKFYNACRIKGEAENVLLARLKLADTARAVLKDVYKRQCVP